MKSPIDRVADELWFKDGSVEDLVNHPKHYSSHPPGKVDVECSYGTEVDSDSRRHVRKADRDRTCTVEAQHALAMHLPMRPGDSGLPTEPALRTSGELRLQTGARCESPS